MGGLSLEKSPLSSNRLFVHDIHIASYHLRAIVSRLSDGLTLFAGFAAMVAFARYGILSLQTPYRDAVVSIAASLLAPYIYYVLAQRVAFFRSNSVLAELALNAAIARRYVFMLAFIVCLAIIVVLLLPDSSLMLNFFVSFYASLLIAILLSKAFAALQHRISHQKQKHFGELIASRYLGSGLPFAAAGGAATVFFAASFVDVDFAAAIATFTIAALSLWYSPISYAAIEYERLIGLSPGISLRTKLRDLFLVGATVTGGASLSLNWQITGVVVAVFVLLLFYKGLEVLIVRACGANKTQIMMVVILFGLTSIAMVLPYLAMILVPVCAWWLFATGRKRTWQLS